MARRARAASPIARFGAVTLGAIGAVVGLVVGLDANPRTAWFAVFEAGIPGAIVGAVVGLWVGALWSTARWLDRRARPRANT